MPAERRTLPGLIGWLLWTPLRLTIAVILRAAIWTFQKPGRAAIVLAVAALAVGSGYYLWFRNSSLASVDRIRVEGTTIQIDEINAAIASAAAGMTTLNVDAGALEDALAHFPTVAGVEVSADFPHEMTVTVIERTPVAVVSSGDRLIAVDGEGTVLDGVAGSELSVPVIEAESAPAMRISGDALTQIEVIAAAPAALRGLIEDSLMANGEVVLTMKGGVQLRFGPPEDLEHKWAAASAVLADPTLVVAAYVDLRIPARPAVGDGSAPPPSEGVDGEEGKPSTGDTGFFNP